jgi:hypothetical protein
MRKPPPNATNLRAQIMDVERQLEELAKISPPDKALRSRQAIDLLIGVRANELYRLR